MNRSLTLISLLVVAAFGMGMISGCAPTASETTATAVGEGVSLIDGLGRTVEFEKAPERIVIAGKATPLLINSFYLFEETLTKVVGIETRSQSNVNFQILVDADAAQKNVLEKDAGPEQIAPLNPDVVVMKSYMQEKLGNPIEQIDIPVVYFDLETPEQFYRDIEIMGLLLGNSMRAAEINEFYQQRVEMIKAASSEVDDAEKPRVLMLQYSEDGGEVAFEVPSADYLQTILVELAGGNAIWKDEFASGGWNVVNFEQIAAWNPDMIYVVDYSGNGPEVVDNFKQDPQWQALSAMKTGWVFAFPNDFLSWDQPDPRWLLGLEWLAKVTLPQQFIDLNLDQEVADFYAFLYNLPPDTIETQVMPLLDGYIFSVTD